MTSKISRNSELSANNLARTYHQRVRTLCNSKRLKKSYHDKLRLLVRITVISTLHTDSRQLELCETSLEAFIDYNTPSPPLL